MTLMATYQNLSAGAELRSFFFSGSASQLLPASSGTVRTSTLPASNSAVAVLISGMMRAISESVLGGPSK